MYNVGLIMTNVDSLTKIDCTICKIIEGQIPSCLVLENEKIIAFMDIVQPQPGHLLIVPRDHHSRLDTMPSDLWVSMIEATHRLTHAIYQSLSPAGLNLLLSDGPAAGQELMHVHLHILTRKNGDGTLGINTGNSSTYSEIADIAEQIKKKLSQ